MQDTQDALDGGFLLADEGLFCDLEDLLDVKGGEFSAAPVL